MAHAYVIEGERHAGIQAARTYAREALQLDGEHHPDLLVFQYGLFSVDDAREVARFASSSPIQGDKKVVVIAATRIFHEAQNALLKLFEEPPQGVVLVLVVPSLGQLLPTLRSRVLVLSSEGMSVNPAEAFLALTAAEREKFITKILDRTKSDKDEEKQAARGELLSMVEGLVRLVYEANKKNESEKLRSLLTDLDTFLPILHERSAPLKLICEHLLLVLPKSLNV